MSSRMRVTKGHTNNRRSHHKIKAPRLSFCKEAGEYHQRHRMCIVDGVGYYRGKEIILKKNSKKGLVTTAETTEEVKETKSTVKKSETTEIIKKEAVKKSTSKQGDDLTKIEGVGPKIASVLAENKIDTFAKLAKTDAEKVSEILAENKLSQHDPKTWGQQAELAASDKWDELKELQDKLDGGK